MVTLDYELSPSWNRRVSEIDLRAADEMTLRYDCFLGDTVFVVRHADFSAPWGWVPVVDFAASLQSIAASLVDKSHQVFEFTESDATIHFSRVGGEVTLQTNYAQAATKLPLADLARHTECFLARVVEDLQRKHPELGENTFFAALRHGRNLPNTSASAT